MIQSYSIFKSVLLASALSLTLLAETGLAGPISPAKVGARALSAERRHTDDTLSSEVSSECTITCAPFLMKMDACKSASPDPDPKAKIGCECESSLFTAWIDCAMCQPEMYDSQDGKLMGVVMRQINQCEANNLPVSVDMTRIPGYPYVDAQAGSSDLRVKEVSASTEADDTTTRDAIRTPDKAATSRSTSTAVPVTTSRMGEATSSSSADEETSEEPVSSASSFKLQGRHAMAIGFGFMLALVFF